MFNLEAAAPVEQEDTDKSFEEFFLYLKDVRKEIDDHEITCVLGDDKSTRRAALIIGRTINKIYRARSEEVVPQLFIDPSSHLGAIGTSSGLGSKDETRLKGLERRVDNMFDKQNIKRGTLLLITDFVHTGNTVAMFENIAKRRSMGFKFISNELWYGDEDSGLIQNYNPFSISAKPYITSEKFKNKETALHRTIMNLFTPKMIDHSNNILYSALRDLESGSDFKINKDSDLINIISNNKYIHRDDLIRCAEELIFTMTDEQKDILLRHIKKWSVKVFRQDIDDISTKLATKFLESD